METNEDPTAEKPDSFWQNIYLAVVATTVVVVTALFAFGRYFS